MSQASQIRKIAIFTGNRAEYGLQFPIIKAVSAHPNLKPYLLVSGAHLQEDFGFTAEEIARDGFQVYREVKIDMPGDTLYATTFAIGSGIISLSKILDELKPDFLLVYADRFEGLSALITSTQMGIPTAHIEGGDLTDGGALDDSVRHAMTKLAHIHFTTNEEAKNRIIKMGEEPWRVFNVGFPAIDLLNEGKFASPENLQKQFQIDPARPFIIFTQHSVTTEHDSAVYQIRSCLEAINQLLNDGIQVVTTYPNNDAGGKRIIHELVEFSKKAPSHFKLHKSVGRFNYHGFLNLAGRVATGACVGNSSSGIKETPYFGCPTVNIGSRQNSRLRSTNVIDCDYQPKNIYQSIKRALLNQDFRTQCSLCDNPYGKGNSGKTIAEILANQELSPQLIQKKMTY